MGPNEDSESRKNLRGLSSFEEKGLKNYALQVTIRRLKGFGMSGENLVEGIESHDGWSVASRLPTFFPDREATLRSFLPTQITWYFRHLSNEHAISSSSSTTSFFLLLHTSSFRLFTIHLQHLQSVSPVGLFSRSFSTISTR